MKFKEFIKRHKVASSIIGFLVVCGLISSCSSKDVTVENDNEEQVALTDNDVDFPKEEKQEEQKEKEEVSTEFKQCLKKAENYIGYVGGFSEQGLREQLEFEKFGQEAIDYAMENIEVDYASQCLDKAESYMENVGGFSEQGLREQLEYEKFTKDEIDYAIDKVYR